MTTERLREIAAAIDKQLAAGERIPADSFWQMYLGTVNLAIRAEADAIDAHVLALEQGIASRDERMRKVAAKMRRESDGQITFMDSWADELDPPTSSAKEL